MQCSAADSGLRVLIYTHGLPQVDEEDARAVTANVAYTLQQLHADGLLFRNVCPEAIILGDPACLATARSVNVQSMQEP